MKLLQNVTTTVNQVCKRLKADEGGGGTPGGGGGGGATSGSWRKRIKAAAAGGSSRLNPNSVHAVKNTRKKMEDRHVVIHDLNTIYSNDHKVREIRAFFWWGGYSNANHIFPKASR